MWQVKLFWVLSALDVALTYHALKTPGMKEGNPLIGPDPTLPRLIIHKAVFGRIIINHTNAHGLRITNVTLAAAVINNARIMTDNKAW